jgi:microcystin degradation protein MlrC
VHGANLERLDADPPHCGQVVAVEHVADQDHVDQVAQAVVRRYVASKSCMARVFLTPSRSCIATPALRREEWLAVFLDPVEDRSRSLPGLTSQRSWRSMGRL